MRMRFRMKVSAAGRWVWVAVGACAAGLMLAGAAGAFEDPGSRKASGSEGARTPSPAEARLREDVTYLAADEREGRGPGTRGIEEAADYISFVFKSAGLRPAAGADGYFQPFTIGGSPSLGKSQELALNGPSEKTLEGRFPADFTPLAIGTGGTLKDVPIVFAGYGITARDESRKLDYDDYSGIDVKGKAVLILRREPQDEDATSSFDGKRTSRYATFQHKATNAFQHGAVAVLLVNDRLAVKDHKDELLRFENAGTQPYSKIPFLMLTRAFADRLLADAGQPSLEKLEGQIDADLRPRSRALDGWKLSGRLEVDINEIRTKNVIGVLEGAGPHAEETVVIGGHYDHLGHGGVFSGSLAPLSRDIHNGADDNASGTAMVLELARRLGARRDPPPRRIVFMAFSGEERGLLGSQYYVRHPLFPLSSTVMMFNCDMVGRLNDKEELTMIGTGTSPGLEELVDALGGSAGLKIKKVAGMTDGFGGSDHQSFYPHDIPVLFAFTGVHREYHRPTDDPHLINYAGMARIADYLELLVLDVVRRPERPAFTRAAGRSRPRMAANHAPDSPVFLGVRPGTPSGGKRGVAIDDVSADSPAARGGLKVGDIITLLGGRRVATVLDFMESIGVHKPGDEIDILVERAGKELKLRVKLANRPAPEAAAGADREDTARMGSVYLGTMPDYAATAEEGMKIQGVSEGSPAEKGGLKGGDVIIRLGDRKVGTIYDYMEALGARRPGEEVDVTVKRDGKEIKLRVKLGTRSGR